MSRRHLAILTLLAIAQPAFASTTLCAFVPFDSAPGYEIEFIGDERIAAVQLNLAEGPQNLPDGSFTVRRFVLRTGTLDFSYRNPGDARLPPSFRLRSKRNHATLRSEGRAIAGTLDCGT